MENAALAVSIVALLIAGYSAYNTLRSRQASQASAATAQAALSRQERIDREKSQRVHFSRRPGREYDTITVTQDGPATAHDVTFSHNLMPENGYGTSASLWPKGYAEGFVTVPETDGEDLAVPSVQWTDADGNPHSQSIV